MNVKQLVLITSATVLLGAVTGCGATTSQEPSSAPGAAAEGTSSSLTPVGLEGLVAGAPDVPEDRTARLWANISWDGTRLALPDELAAAPDVRSIVAGTIQSIEPGPVLYAASSDDPQAEQQVVIGVQVAAVMKGAMPRDGMVYIQLSGSKPLEQYRAGLPVGAVTGIYLEDPPQADNRVVVGQPAAGRPDGQPVWQVGPQGFIVADGAAGGVVFPLASEIAPKLNFLSLLPTVTE